jgi:hypothetical protein
VGCSIEVATAEISLACRFVSVDGNGVPRSYFANVSFWWVSGLAGGTKDVSDYGVHELVI